MPDITKSLERATPFIEPIHTSGGTFYTFSSAAEDLTLSFNTDTSKKFKFSKFALLNIPDFLTSDPVLNTVRLKAIPGAYQYVDFSRTTKLNHFFAESFENYCLNLETMILSDNNYNPRLTKTVSERVFFKWLKELGAIRFKQEMATGINDSRFTEEDDISGKYNRVVQYIGDIDFVNNLSTQINSYSEVYVHVPTEVGNFPKVYFQSIDDENYSAGMTFARNTDGTDNEYIFGRSSSDVNPAALDIHAYYDNDIGLPTSALEVSGRIYTQWKKKSTASDFVIPEDYTVNNWWYYQTSDTNNYYLEPDQFEDSSNDDLAISTGDDPNPDQTAIKFRRSRLDGISIDFDYNTYSGLSENAITSLINVAQLRASTDFEFNTVLIYYDLYEDAASSYTYNTTSTNVYPTDSDSYADGFGDLSDPLYLNYLTNLETNNSNKTLATNLFGILFLDNVEDNLSLSGGYIPRFKKVRPNSVTKLNGNAYGLKVNMKLDVSPINSGVVVEKYISNSNTFSMDAFADALNSFKTSAENMQNLVFNTLIYDSRLSVLENFIKKFDENTIGSLINRILKLETTINNSISTTNITNTTDLLSLIEKNYNLLLNIINGKTPVSVAYDLNNFVAGNGINLDILNNRMTIDSINNNFNFQDNKKECSVYKDWDAIPLYLKGTKMAYTYEVTLKPLKNYLRITDETSFIPNKDMILYINDGTTSWETGQTFRIYFTNPIKMQNQNGDFDFYIYTDYLNVSRSIDKYSALITKISYKDFESKNYRPIIEIICKEPGHFDFFIDYLNF